MVLEGSAGGLAIVEQLLSMQWTLGDEQKAVARTIFSHALATAHEGSTCFDPLGPGVTDKLVLIYKEANVKTTRRKLKEKISNLISDPSFSTLFGDDGDSRPLVRVGSRLHVQRLWLRERRIADWVRTQIAQPQLALADFVNGSISEEQAQAVSMARTTRLGIITGGPGTGKTTVIAEVVKGWISDGVSPSDILVAAPTGKAANRLAESLRRQQINESIIPTTLHSCLEYSPTRGFGRNSRFPLGAKRMIVDESSMVDLTLMEGLVAALRSDCFVLLVGDAEQLPPVDAGAPFADLVNQSIVPKVCLTKNFRVGASEEADQIISIGTSIRDGQNPRLATFEKIADVRGVGFVELDGEASVNRMLFDWWNYCDYSSWIRALENSVTAEDERLLSVLSALGNNQLLTATRQGIRGSQEVNKHLLTSFAGRVKPGVPMLICRNDRRLGVANGDVGVVCDDNGALRLALQGNGGVRLLPLSQLRVEPAYALTVHKSQGSEYDFSALLLPERKSRVLDRSLIYTALTRSKKRAVVMGNQKVWAMGVKSSLTRETGLGSLLS